MARSPSRYRYLQSTRAWDVWAGSDTTAQETLDWIAETIAANPRSAARTTNRFKILIAHCTEGEFDTLATGSDLHIASEQTIASWMAIVQRGSGKDATLSSKRFQHTTKVSDTKRLDQLTNDVLVGVREAS